MTGFVYYDEVFGHIKAVSMREVEGSTLPFIVVDDAEALPFLEGSRDVGQWTVDSDLRLISTASLRLDLTWVGGWDAMPCGEGAIAIVVRTSPECRYAEVSLEAPAQLMIESQQTDRIRLIMTRSHDPDTILAAETITIRELNQSRTVIIHLPVMPETFDVHTLPFVGVSYRHEIVDTVSPTIPLPKGRFEDIVPMQRGTPTGPALVAHLDAGQIHIRTVRGGGPRYDRGRDYLGVSICARNNPDHLIYNFRIPLKELDSGYTIGYSGLYDKVDLFTDLMYRDAFFTEYPCNIV